MYKKYHIFLGSTPNEKIRKQRVDTRRVEEESDFQSESDLVYTISEFQSESDFVTGRNTAGGGGCAQANNVQVLKKGPWMAAEDAILMEYVKKHGEGNWNASISVIVVIIKPNLNASFPISKHLKASRTVIAKKILLKLGVNFEMCRNGKGLPGLSKIAINTFHFEPCKSRISPSIVSATFIEGSNGLMMCQLELSSYRICSSWPEIFVFQQSCRGGAEEIGCGL
ncbi:hypothetical protein L1887_18942 [Cichorium endivia]|nr:hypothetical protein L1887_18939 [Cichorium endivia]KAI3511784.1 hypothetical protein L1887_18942 [Cichorium endivia]